MDIEMDIAFLNKSTSKSFLDLSTFQSLVIRYNGRLAIDRVESWLI